MVRALIVDDHTLFAEALGGALRREGHVTAVAGTGAEALGHVRREGPDIVLLDLGLGAESGLDVGASILAERPDTKLLAVTAGADAALVDDAVAAGFHGYVRKDAGLADLVASVEAVMAGRSVLPPSEGEVAVDGSRDVGAQLAASLTSREVEILRLLADGTTTKEIASRLHIASNTVRSHVQAVMSKLQVHTRLGAVAFAQRHGLLQRPIGRFGSRSAGGLN